MYTYTYLYICINGWLIQGFSHVSSHGPSPKPGDPRPEPEEDASHKRLGEATARTWPWRQSSAWRMLKCSTRSSSASTRPPGPTTLRKPPGAGALCAHSHRHASKLLLPLAELYPTTCNARRPLWCAWCTSSIELLRIQRYP